MSKILIVDDNPVDRHIAGGFVEERGLTPIYAENGVKALELIELDKPDIVLSDVNMPEMDGLSLVEQVRDRHPGLPVMLMTAFGSEAMAVNALRAGAASYVPKKEFKAELSEALRTVLAMVEARQSRETVHAFLQRSESEFVLGSDHEGSIALVSYLESVMAEFKFLDEASLLQVSTALGEALSNAIDHGNLELDSSLRQSDDCRYSRLREERTQQHPYRERSVHVKATLTPTQATYVVRDEGAGFDPSTVPDPSKPETILKPSGRGLFLIRMFMDQVIFNDIGNEITMVKCAP